MNTPTHRSPGLCSEPFCGRRTHGWSGFCGLHAARLTRYGHTALRSGIRETELRPFAQWVRPLLGRYRNTKGTASVLKAIDEFVLNFKGSEIIRAERDFERIAQLLRSHEVNATDVLTRVCIFQAYAAANQARFHGSLKAENLALGRMVLRLVPMQRSGQRYATRSVLVLAELLRQVAVPYCDRVIELAKQESSKMHELVLASLDLSTREEVPAGEPRAGTRRRRKFVVRRGAEEAP